MVQHRVHRPILAHSGDRPHDGLFVMTDLGVERQRAAVGVGHIVESVFVGHFFGGLFAGLLFYFVEHIDVVLPLLVPRPEASEVHLRDVVLRRGHELIFDYTGLMSLMITGATRQAPRLSTTHQWPSPRSAGS